MDPKEGFEELTNLIAFYAGRVDAAYIGDEKVTPQAGDFYGGLDHEQRRRPVQRGSGHPRLVT